MKVIVVKGREESGKTSTIKEFGSFYNLNPYQKEDFIAIVDNIGILSCGDGNVRDQDLEVKQGVPLPKKDVYTEKDMLDALITKEPKIIVCASRTAGKVLEEINKKFKSEDIVWFENLRCEPKENTAQAYLNKMSAKAIQFIVQGILSGTLKF